MITIRLSHERDGPCCRTEVFPNHLRWYAFCALLKISMEVMIGLARADYEKLVNDVPIGSCAYDVLHRSPQQLHHWGEEKPFSMCVIVECERPDEAIALLEAARKHCPGAIPNIMYALKESGALYLITPHHLIQNSSTTKLLKH